MSTFTSQDLRCPQCDAHVRAGSQWCALCYCDLRPAEPVAEPVAEPAAELVAERVAEASPAPESLIGPGRGKHARGSAAETPGSPETTEPSAADALVNSMLAQLAVEESGVSLGRFTGALDSPGRKVGLMIIGSAVLTGGVVLIMTLLGVLL